MNSYPVSNKLEELPELGCLAHLAHLGAWANRYIHQQVSGACGKLLGEDRGHHLPHDINTKGALHGDKDIVHWCKPGGSSPGETPPMFLHY